jgi:hypothetical protein
LGRTYSTHVKSLKAAVKKEALRWLMVRAKSLHNTRDFMKGFDLNRVSQAGKKLDQTISANALDYPVFFLPIVKPDTLVKRGFLNILFPL